MVSKSLEQTHIIFAALAAGGGRGHAQSGAYTEPAVYDSLATL